MKFTAAVYLLMALVFVSSCNSLKKAALSPCVSNSSTTEQRIVDSAACALAQMRDEMDGPTIDYLLSEARAVFIFPDVYKAAFMVGAEAGPGVLCAKDSTGFWNGPAFFNIAGVDLGLQGGVAGKTVLIFLMDDEALEMALAGKVDLSMGADVAIGRIGDHSSRGVFDAQGNIYSLVYQAGMFGGMAYRVGALMVSSDFNKRYYGKKVKVKDLLLTHKHDKPAADRLLLTLLGL